MLCKLLGIILSCICSVELTFGDRFCDAESECSGQNITDTIVACQGFDSCSNAPSIIATSSFVADGAFSAYNCTNVESSSTSSTCGGESSCRNIKNLQTRQTVYCYGSQSCFNTTITRTSSSTPYTVIHLDGYKSAAYSTFNIYQKTNIYAKGALSLYNANINFYNSSTLWAYQDFSLNGASIYCASGQTCRIWCFGYGCANISSANGNGTYDSICDYNYGSNKFCNDSIYSYNCANDRSTIDLPSALTESLIDPNDIESFDRYSLYKNGEGSSFVGIHCSDNEECKDLLLNYTNQAILCTSHEGCLNTNILITINGTYISKYNASAAIGIYCGGWYSCWTSNNDKFIINVINDDYNYYYDENTTYSFDIDCDGGFACADLQLEFADNLLCGGYYSCGQAKILLTKKSIFGLSTWGLYLTNISNTSGNIYCVATQVCYGTRMTQTSGNIYGIGYEAMIGSIIQNTIDNTIIEKIIAIGALTGDSMTVHNVKLLHATGYETLKHSIISGIRSLYVNGIDVLASSSIITGLSISDDSVDSRVILDISGLNDYSYDVLCSFGDECFIYCRSNTSCSNMSLICDGICYISCGYYIECPQNISGNGTWHYNTISTQNPTDTAHATNISDLYSTNDPQSVIPSVWLTTTNVQTTNNDDDARDNNVILLIVVIFSSVICTVFCICVGYCLYVRRKEGSHISNKKVNKFRMNELTESDLKNSRLKIPTLGKEKLRSRSGSNSVQADEGIDQVVADGEKNTNDNNEDVTTAEGEPNNDEIIDVDHDMDDSNGSSDDNIEEMFDGKSVYGCDATKNTSYSSKNIDGERTRQTSRNKTTKSSDGI